MKKLRQFQEFNHEAFLKDKSFVVKEVKPVIEYVNGERTDKEIGTNVVCLITRDDTKYSEDGSEEGVNLYETISFKVPKNNFELNQKSKVRPVRITKATVYGNFMNNLSIECEDVLKVENKNGATQD